MSDDFDDDDFENDDHDTDGGQDRNPLRAQIKRLEKQVRSLTTKAQSGETAVREVAFLKAGVNPDDPKAKYFVKAYDGELTTAAIKAEAEAAGVIAATEEAPKDDIPSEEKDSHQRVDDTGTGAGSAGARDWVAEVNAAKTPGEMLQILREAEAAGGQSGLSISDGAYVPQLD